MSNMDEVINSVKYIINNGGKDFYVLIPNYPTKSEDLNLFSIKTMEKGIVN